MRRGYLINMTVLLLLIPLLLLAATYESISSAIVVNQAERSLMERQYFSMVTLQDDLQNAVDLSFKRAYISLTEYVINNTNTTQRFVSNASESLEELMKYGTIGGTISPTMGDVTLESWYSNFVNHLSSMGMSIEPSTPEELFNSHMEMLIGPIDSFHVAVRVKLKNITITDSSGRIRYSGDFPADGYVYSIVSVEGFEDPFIVVELNGLYTRIIEPCSNPYPGEEFGYYNISNSTQIEELVLDWCYLGLNDTVDVKYPTILERFEGNMRNHQYYLNVAAELRKELGITGLPLGLVTFLVPSPQSDPTLLGALVSLGAHAPSTYTSVDYYYLKCAIEGACFPYFENTDQISDEYPTFRLDQTTKKLVFNQ
ncbi:hypothetical protein [Thermococcus peptonophilus]|uniref:Uncharacterized protein n=1 Tax=Thermococcus peptonophilus TaxID=53952 RepID=A0A142CVW8_9EURY|nr:hypothetical protein [Thermococcus peptonophilus]AMQ18920.1 hypothetical protein A0127_06920 [Thermococcus peptonophilus]